MTRNRLFPRICCSQLCNSGGQVIGAFDNNAMIGVLIGLVGLQDDQSVFISSKRMVVLPAYRSRGVGAMLKYAQP